MLKPSIEWINERLDEMHPVEIIIKPKNIIDYLSLSIEKTFGIKKDIATKIVMNMLDGKYIFRRIITENDPDSSKISVIIYRYKKGEMYFKFIDYLKGYNGDKIIWVDNHCLYNHEI